MVGFDDCRFTKTRLDDVWINGSLNQKIYRTNLFGFLFKYSDKLFAYDLSLLLRFGYASQLFIKALLGIYSDKIQIVISIWAEYCFYFVSFIFAEKSMIHENAGQLLSNCF